MNNYNLIIKIIRMRTFLKDKLILILNTFTMHAKPNKIKIYIAGPITDLPENNIDEFRIVETILKKKGYDTIVPHDLFYGIDTQHFSHHDYMNICLPAAKNCSCLCFLEGWKESKGAIMEMEIAIENNLKVVFAKNFLPDYLAERLHRQTTNINRDNHG
jgi:hypothetical protein